MPHTLMFQYAAHPKISMLHTLISHSNQYAAHPNISMLHTLIFQYAAHPNLSPRAQQLVCFTCHGLSTIILMKKSVVCFSYRISMKHTKKLPYLFWGAKHTKNQYVEHTKTTTQKLLFCEEVSTLYFSMFGMLHTNRLRLVCSM